MLDSTVLDKGIHTRSNFHTKLTSEDEEVMRNTPFPLLKDAETQVNMLKKNARTQVIPRTVSKGYSALLATLYSDIIIFILHDCILAT